MKRIYIFIFLCFSVMITFSQITTTTVKNGNWSDAATWNNGVPSWGMNAVVNHKITLDANVNLGSGDITINSGASLIGSYDISIWDQSGFFKNYGNVQINTLTGNGTFYNEGTLVTTKVSINSSGSIDEFTSTGTLSVNGDVQFNQDVNILLSGTVKIDGTLQLGNRATLINNAAFRISGNTSINDDASFTNNNRFESLGDIWAGKVLFTNNGTLEAQNFSGEATILNTGTITLNSIDNLYGDGSITNTNGATFNVAVKILLYGNTNLINDGTFTVSPSTDLSSISGDKFINHGNFSITANKTEINCNTVDNYGELTVYDITADAIFNNYANFYVSNDITSFSGSNEFYNHANAEFRVTGNMLIWQKVFVNEGFVYVGGDVKFGSGISNLNNKNVFVTKGNVLNQAKFNNNGAFYCIGTGDFKNDWGSSTEAVSCGHVNVGCNNFNDYGAVKNMNIHGKYNDLGGDPPVNLSTNPWIPCSGIDIRYYSRADGNWEDYDACSGLCVWSIEQIRPDPIYEYPRYYGRVTIDNNLITINKNTTPQPLSCDSLALKPLGKLTIDETKALTVNGDFIINSPENSGATGSLIDNGTINITGNKTVQRFITGYNWHYIGFPTDGVKRSDFNTTNFYYYDETTNDTWNADNIYGTPGWTNPGSGSLNTPMKGYIYYYYDDMLEFTGNLNTGDKSITLSYTNNNPDHPEFDGWNLVANPYPSAVDWDAVNTTGIVDNCIYYYDDDGSSPYYNNYRYYIKGGGGTSPYPSIAVNGGQRYIPVGQAFFVRTTTNGQTLDFSNAVRVHSDQDFYKNQQPEVHPDLLRLQVSGNGGTDETIIRFIPEATDSLDSKFDAIKFFSYYDNLPQIFTITSAGNNLVVNTLPDYHERIIYLGLKTLEAGNYTFTFTEFNFDKNVKAYLIDKFTGSQTDIEPDASYKFESDSGVFTNRFEIRFKVASDISDLEKNIIIWAQNKQIHIHNLETNSNASYEVFGSDGRIISKGIFQETDEIIYVPVEGIYLVKIVDKKQIIVRKLVVM